MGSQRRPLDCERRHRFVWGVWVIVVVYVVDVRAAGGSVVAVGDGWIIGSNLG